MKILIISNTFYPKISPRAFRTTELAKELTKQGHEVKVIVPALKQDYEVLLKDFSSLKIEQTKVLSWKDFSKKKPSILDTFIRKLRWFLIIFFEYPLIEWWVKMPKILKKERNYDLLISIAVPHSIHWGVARCFRKKIPLAKKWIADCGDPYMGVKTSQYKHPFYFKYFEKSFCRRADFITIPVESAREAYYKEFHSKIKVIPQGFNFNEIKRSAYEKNETKRFCYAGAFYTQIRDPRPLLNFLLELKDDFEFTVFTRQPSFLSNYKTALGEKLIVKDYVPRKELVKHLSSMDFLVNLENGTNAQIPSKLIDYALAGRPILSIDSQNFDKKKVLEFLKGDYSNQLKIENLEDYNIKTVAEKFIDLAR